MECKPNPANLAFRSRLKMVAEKLGGVSGLARAAGFNESTVRQWVDGPAEPNRTKLVALATVAGVDVGWLATGQGPPTRDPTQDQGTAEPAPAPLLERQPRREAAPRTGLYEPDEDPAYHRWPLDIGVFHAIVNAADSVGADLDRGDRTEISRWMYLAIDIMTRSPDNRRRLDDADMQALARIVRKLVFTEEDGE